MIYEAEQELVFHRPLEETLEAIMVLAQRAVPFERGALMLRHNRGLVARVVRTPPAEAGRTPSVRRAIVNRVLRHGEPVLTSDAPLDERAREQKSLEHRHLRSIMCVPLRIDRDVIGMIYVESRQRASLFAPEDLRLLTCLANIAAVKIENARLFNQTLAANLMEQELQKAAEIQGRLLPDSAPLIPGYQIHGCSLPCHEVGGDYFDYLELPGGRCGIALGDVAGKGLASALLMCAFQASMRVLCGFDLSPEELLARLNGSLLPRIPLNRFVTFFYGVLDPAQHTLTYVNAGQTWPLLVRRAGMTERLTLSGLPLAVSSRTRYEAGRVELEAGDLLVCYSDGVTEAASPEGEEFGEEKLTHLVHEARAFEPREVCRRITGAVQRHHAGSPRQDDITLVVLKRTE